MIELQADIWDPCFDDYELPVWRVVPTNGSRNRFGQAVMGRGVAKQAQDRFPGIRTRLGLALREQGNQVFYFSKEGLITFPVKKSWDDGAEIGIIRQSCRQLVELMRESGQLGMVPSFMVFPRVGCGNGGLRWTEVRPVLEAELKPLEEFYCVVWTPGYEGQ